MELAMATWDLTELARVTKADVVGGALPKSVEAVGTDTRSLPSSSLFVALRGPRFDGHRFAPDAARAGAIAVVVDREGVGTTQELGVPRLVVDDTLKALGDLAQHARSLHQKPVVAVTGSNGKTSTKELCAAALGCRGTVHKTQGNFNNLIGLPLTVFQWRDEDWAAVLEMGMSVPGEIARLTQIAQPNVGVITNVAAAHLEGVGGLAGVAAAKGELYAGLSPDSVAVVNADDANIRRIAIPLIRGKRISFGRSEDADVRIAAAKTSEKGLELTIDVFGELCTVFLPLFGQHNAMNAAAAMACAAALELPMGKVSEMLAAVSVPGGRLRVMRNLSISTGKCVNVIDDTYNANPASVAAALDAQKDLAGGSRRLAALGDMLELGTSAAQLHRQVGEAAQGAGVTGVYALGDCSEHVAKGMGAGGAAFKDLRALVDALKVELEDGDWLLVKESRGMRMERVIDGLIEQGGQA